MGAIVTSVFSPQLKKRDTKHAIKAVNRLHGMLKG